jgi:hypothetical protein
MTMSSGDFFPVMFRDGGSVSCYADGGLASSANATADAGRGGDDIIVHMNRDELEQLSQMWGKPTINPETGAPEFFLKGMQDWFKDNEWAGYALPIATSVLAPGIGSAVGSTVNDGLGLGLGAQGTAALGSGLVGAGLGALTGGGKGALMGGLLGGATGYLTTDAYPDMAHGGMGPDVPKGIQPAGTKNDSGSVLGGLFGGGSGGSGALSKALPLMLAAGAMGLGSSNNKQTQPANTTSPDQQAAIDRNNRPLSQVKIQTQRNRMPSPEDLRNYGRSGTKEYEFFDDNQLPLTKGYADGGDVMGIDPMAHQSAPQYVEGPGTGREDKIPALLSDGEYVFDAESVALLGDGSSEAGAGALEQMRQNIRKHKGGALAKGAISPDARPPEAYLPKGVL